MQCPYCEEELEKGYIDQTDFRFPLEWYPAKQETGFFRSRKGRIKLTSAFDGGYIVAYHCAKCGKFIIDQSQNGEA